MRAVYYHNYGPPNEVLEIAEKEKPVPKDDEVLVRVYAAPVNAGDWHLIKGEPFPVRLMFGLSKPKNTTPGSDLAGVVEIAGNGVKSFNEGDEVIGCMSDAGFGSYAEYVCVPEKFLSKKPDGVTFEEAAAMPVSSITPLQALRDHGNMQKGQKVLINGASGGVGSYAVQIAKALGGEVTGVCSTKNVEFVKSLGADHVIDYKKEDFTNSGKQYDLIIDTAAYKKISEYKKVLTPDGTYVMIGGETSKLFKVMLTGWMHKKKIKTMLMKHKQEDLDYIKVLMESGKLKTQVDKIYPMEKVRDAFEYFENGGKSGKIILKIN